MSSFGDKIRNRRVELEMTQQELAERVGYKHKSSINKIELGLTDVTVDQAEVLADALDVPVSYLMGWTGERENYYTNPETAALAQRIYEDKTLRALFDVAADATPADLQAAHLFLKALKERERQG